MSVDDTIAQVARPTGSLSALLGQTLAGRYRIDSLIGEGGMGSVFRAHHLRLKHDVAVKILNPELNRHPEAASRFEREAQASSRLEHPNIVRVIDFGDVEIEGFDGAIKYLVMQLLEGRELSEHVGTPLGVERSLRLVAQILDGLVHAHERGVVHRDLKPDNVFVTVDHTGAESLKIVDFGIAKLLDTGEGPAKQLTQVGMVFGTPAYMSPEQAVGNPVDERTDIYAVGVMLYEMLTGQRPFRSKDPMTLLRMQILAEVEPIEGLRPDVQLLLNGLMAKEPDQRIPTAVAALEHVQALLGPSLAPATVSAPISVDQSVSAPRTVLGVDELSGPLPAPSASISFGDTMREHLRGLGDEQRRWIWSVAAAVVVVGGVTIALASGADGNEDDPPIAVAAADPAAAAEAKARQTVSELAEAVGLRAPDDRLQQLDLLIADKNLKAAHLLLEELDEEFSDDGRLVWRKARLLRHYRGRRDEMFASYILAMQLERSLLDDVDFAREVAGLLGQKDPDRRLLDAVAAEPREAGAAMLLELVNHDQGALDYARRHVALDAVQSQPEVAKQVNRPLNVALDLWQAPQSAKPCATYLAALQAADADPDPFLRGSVERAPVPERGPQEAADACDEAEDRRNVVAAGLKAKYPDAELVFPADYAREGKRRGRKKRRRGLFGIFR